MNEALEEYLQLQEKMLAMRHKGDDVAEDSILDRMDVVWLKLTPEDRRVLILKRSNDAE